MPAPESENGEALAFVVLADCSGSMEGTSIRQLRKAPRILPSLVHDGDEFDLIALGSHAEIRFDPLSNFDKEKWPKVVNDLDADLGDTEFDAAFETAQTLFELAELDVKPIEGVSLPAPRNVLLITDGLVTNVKARVRKLLRLGLRVHILAVG